MKGTVGLAVFCGVLLCCLPAESVREEDIKYLESMLIAPCYFLQPVAVHESEAAYRVKAEVRTRLEQGKSPDEILQAYTEEYGIQILQSLPLRDSTLWHICCLPSWVCWD